MNGQPDLARRLRSELAGRLHKVMAERGVTIDALAERTGLSRDTVGSICRRQATPTLHTVVVLAGALGVPPAKLAFGEGP